MPWYFFFHITEDWERGGILLAHDFFKAPQREFAPHGLERRFCWYVRGEESKQGNLYVKTCLIRGSSLQSVLKKCIRTDSSDRDNFYLLDKIFL